MLGTDGNCWLRKALCVTAEISGDGNLEALKLIHASSFSVRTATVASPLPTDYGGERKNKQNQ